MPLRPTRSAGFFLIAALAAAVLFGSCKTDSTIAPDAGGRLSLRGRVVDTQNGAIAGVAVRLAQTGPTDTTDSFGRYEISGAESPQTKTGVLDSLVFTLGSRRMALLPVVKWDDTMPDIRFVQRAFSGTVDKKGRTVSKVLAAFSGPGIPPGAPYTTELFFNAPASEFSGFAYFTAAGKEAVHIFFVDILDESGFLIGRSDTISFNGLASNLTVPKFAADNIRIQADAGSDRNAPRSTRLSFHGTGTTTPGARIVEYAWRYGSDSAFQPYENGHADFAVPDSFGAVRPLVLRVLDDRGASAFDTVWLRADPDTVKVIPLDTVKLIRLRGRVVDRDNSPVAGVITNLRHRGLSDTTDGSGWYEIAGTAPPKTGSGILDTLFFSLENQDLAVLAISAWIDTLPDIKLVQRGFSGALEKNGRIISKVLAILSGPGIPGDRPLVTEYFFNAPVSEYSGFSYFPVAGKESAYSVFIEVFDEGGFLMGRSDTVSFNGLAGNVTIPKFTADNIRIRAQAGAFRYAPPGTRVSFHGAGTTVAGARITDYAWRYVTDTGFISYENGHASFTAPDSYSTERTLTLRVTDSRGATAFDTIWIRTGPKFHQDLKALAGEDVLVPPGANKGVIGRAISSNGMRVIEYAWRIFPDTAYARSDTGRFEFNAPVALDSTLQIELRVQNEAGTLAFDTILARSETHFDTLMRRPWHSIIVGTGPAINVSSQAVEHQSKIWLFGANKRIWKSDDGAVWTMTVPDSLAPTITAAPIVSFAGKVWWLGPALWNTDDGVSWTKVTTVPPFANIGHTQATVFKNGIVTVGLKGTWHTTDGINWTQLNPNFIYTSPRAIGVVRDELWVYNANPGADASLSISKDGETWLDRKIAHTLPFTLWGQNQFVQFDGRMVGFNRAYTGVIDRDLKLHANGNFLNFQIGCTVFFKGKILVIAADGVGTNFTSPSTVVYWGTEDL